MFETFLAVLLITLSLYLIGSAGWDAVVAFREGRTAQGFAGVVLGVMAALAGAWGLGLVG
jgi:hypothetical protein